MTSPTTTQGTRLHIRRRVVVVVVVAAAVVAGILALDQPSRIFGYRVADDRTLVVTSVEGPGALTRVSSVVETATTVTVSVRSFLFRPGPGTSEGVLVESTIGLGAPFNGRAVIDGISGLSVPLIP